jgi:hypothetical protein
METFLNCYMKCKHPSLEILNKLPLNEQHLVCHDYAFLKAINQLGTIPAQGENWHNTFNILNNYFIEVDQPQENDLVIYKSFNHIMHTGIIHSSGKVESKWGCHPYPYLHSLFDVPKIYGTTISYYRLNASAQEISDKVHQQMQTYPQSPQPRDLVKAVPYNVQELKLRILSLLILGLGYHIYK